MRADIIKKIKNNEDLTHVFILTYNIDFMFMETVLLRALDDCGHPVLTIFADAEEASRSFDNQHMWLTQIGRRYRVVPIRMKKGYRFHPKAILLSSIDNAELLIGSGNLTYGGYRYNDEIWKSYKAKSDGFGPFSAFKEILQQCSELAMSSKRFSSDIEEAYNRNKRRWINNEPIKDIIWHITQNESLFESIKRNVTEKNVDEIIICSPYFDDHGVALKAIRDGWPLAKITILVQQKHSQLSREIQRRSGVKFKLLGISSNRSPICNVFNHGKFYAFISSKKVIVFSGSANCSRAALLQNSQNGNAEILTISEMSRNEFEKKYLEDLNLYTENIDLPQQSDEIDSEKELMTVQIVNCFYDKGTLTIQYFAPEQVMIKACVLDDKKYLVTNKSLSNDTIAMAVTKSPTMVSIIYSAGKVDYVSRKHWVDNELSLRYSSDQRQIIHAIESKVLPTTWNLGAWIEIVHLLSGQFIHNMGEKQNIDTDYNKEEVNKKHVYSVDEIFAGSSSLPQKLEHTKYNTQNERILGLQQLLLTYFGEGVKLAQNTDIIENDADSEETVDRPEEKPKKTHKLSELLEIGKISEAEKAKALRIAEKIVTLLNSSDFIRYRHAELLANDIAIVAVLFISGVAEKWISVDNFMELTARVWVGLFFDCGNDEIQNDEPIGWLFVREKECVDISQFRNELSTIPLSAALILWYLICPKGAARIQKIQYELATRIAIARFPWLWNLSRMDEVASEISKIYTRTGWTKKDIDAKWDDFQNKWDALVVEGKALSKLEKLLNEKEISQWNQILTNDIIPQGSLIWQGPLGYGITTEKVSRAAASNSLVFFLRAEKIERIIRTDKMVSVEGLLQTITSMGKNNITQKEALTLSNYFKMLAKG